jgi:serine/threonine protein kinase
LKHPCILAFHGYSPPGLAKEAIIMTEFPPNGTLEENVRSQKPNEPPRLTNTENPTKLAKIVSGIVLGMRFIHSKKVIHHALQPSTIYLDSSWRVRIGDFGSSRFENEKAPLAPREETFRPNYYAAPECFKDEIRTYMVDVFSFGLILYEIVVGKPVFSRELGFKKMAELVLEGKRADIPRTVSREVRRLIKSCWSQNPDDRPSFFGILCDLKKIKFQILPNVKSDKVIAWVDLIEKWQEKQSELCGPP